MGEGEGKTAQHGDGRGGGGRGVPGGGRGGFEGAEGEGAGKAPVGDDLPEGVDGGTVHRPLCDAHLAQVGAGVAGQALAVLKELSAELTGDLLGGLTWAGRSDQNRATGGSTQFFNIG